MPLGGVSLPHIEIPTFDGNVLNWGLFWEQFQAAIQDKLQLAEVDRLTNLQDAIKNGPAKNITQGPTQMAKGYQKAIKCLKECYHWTRLIHRDMSKASCNFHPQANHGRELRKLHDLCKQHNSGNQVI